MMGYNDQWLTDQNTTRDNAQLIMTMTDDVLALFNSSKLTEDRQYGHKDVDQRLNWR